MIYKIDSRPRRPARWSAILAGQAVQLLEALTKLEKPKGIGHAPRDGPRPRAPGRRAVAGRDRAPVRGGQRPARGDQAARPLPDPRGHDRRRRGRGRGDRADPGQELSAPSPGRQRLRRSPIIGGGAARRSWTTACPLRTRPRPSRRATSTEVAAVDPASAGPAARAAPPRGSARPDQILTTEHWSLLTARSLVYNEAFSRGAMFLTFLSASLVALGFVAGQRRAGVDAAAGRDRRPRARPVRRARDPGPAASTPARGDPRRSRAWPGCVTPTSRSLPTSSRTSSTRHVRRHRSRCLDATDRQRDANAVEPLRNVLHGLTTMPGMIAVDRRGRRWARSSRRGRDRRWAWRRCRRSLGSRSRSGSVHGPRRGRRASIRVSATVDRRFEARSPRPRGAAGALRPRRAPEHVAHAADGLEELRVRRVLLELASAASGRGRRPSASRPRSRSPRRAPAAGRG